VGRREREAHPTAAPLLDALNAGKLTRADIQQKLGLGSRQVVTNWLAYGVPARHLPSVAALCGLSTDAYRERVGLAGADPDSRIDPAVTRTEQLLANYGALPAWMQDYFLRKMKEARKYADVLPEFMARDAASPVDEAKLRVIERDFLAKMERFAAMMGKAEAPDDLEPQA